MTLPNFLIIGAQKSATTYLQRSIRKHPNVFMPYEEIPFFEDPFYSQDNLVQFEKLFEAGENKKAVGMKRPNCLGNPICPERINCHLPEAKLIAILRDPVERLISAYYHYILFGFLPPVDINSGLITQINGSSSKKYPISNELVEFGFYYQHLKRYLTYFNPHQMLILLYEDMKKDPLLCIQKVVKFLDIEESTVPLTVNAKPGSAVYSILRLKFLQLRNPILYKYSEDGLHLLQKNKMLAVRKFLFRLTTVFDQAVMNRVFKNTKPEISSEITQKLKNIYLEDTCKLQDLLKIDLSHWKVFEGK